jgi:sugar phosphate isomerase/epimerase
LTFSAFHLEFAEFDGPRTLEELRAVCRLARLLAVPLITVIPAPLGTEIAEEVKRLSTWKSIAEAEGLILCLETRQGTLTGDVSLAIELCHRVPGLGLTLDPTHYMCSSEGPTNYEPLFPYVKHLRIRDSGNQPGEFQLRVGQGELEYGRLLVSLEKYHYDRAISVDIHDDPAYDYPTEPEVRKLKYLIESMV